MRLHTWNYQFIESNMIYHMRTINWNCTLSCLVAWNHVMSAFLHKMALTVKFHTEFPQLVSISSFIFLSYQFYMYQCKGSIFLIKYLVRFLYLDLLIFWNKSVTYFVLWYKVCYNLVLDYLKLISKEIFTYGIV